MSRKLLSAMVMAVIASSGAYAQQKPAAAAPAARSGPTPIPRAQFIADMDTEFRKMDADKNGQLSRTEIEQFQKLQVVAQAQARNRAMFARLDTDRNGQLSPAEFARLATPGQIQGAQPMLTRMDGNKDQQVSLVEHRTATLANFDSLDTDKDGVVSVAEMKAGGIVK